MISVDTTKAHKRDVQTRRTLLLATLRPSSFVQLHLSTSTPTTAIETDRGVDLSTGKTDAKRRPPQRERVGRSTWFDANREKRPAGQHNIKRQLCVCVLEPLTGVDGVFDGLLSLSLDPISDPLVRTSILPAEKREKTGWGEQMLMLLSNAFAIDSFISIDLCTTVCPPVDRPSL